MSEVFMIEKPNYSSKSSIQELADQQIKIYKMQAAELVSHYNREVSALDGYRGRQLLELLQNADDAGVDSSSGCQLLLDLSRQRLVVANKGKPFSIDGLTSLVISDSSPKQLEQQRFIGCKGLGFRSILTWTDSPTISSGQYEVSFDRAKATKTVKDLAASNQEVNTIVARFVNSTRRLPAAIMRFPSVPDERDIWLRTAREFRSKQYDTVIVLPLPEGSRGDEVYVEMKEQVSELPMSALLFCRHLTRVEIAGEIRQAWDVLRQEHDAEHATVILQQAGISALWQIFRFIGQVSADVSGKGSGGRRDYEIAVAVPEEAGTNTDGALCVFFPTNERLPCSMVMHATLETSDDRNRLINNASNREVLRQLAQFVAATLEKQANPGAPRRVLELLSGIEDADPELKELGFVDELVLQCAKRRIFPRIDGRVGSSGDVRQVPHEIWLEQFGGNLLPEILPFSPQDSLSGLIELFNLPWYDASTLKEKLRHYLSTILPEMAGEILGKLLHCDQLKNIGADGLLIGSDGCFIDGGHCFLTPTEQLPVLPTWASNVRFLHQEFQTGLMSGSRVNGIRRLLYKLQEYSADVDEYAFDTVVRNMIGRIDQDALGDIDNARTRWRELLLWIYHASSGGNPTLPYLNIKVITTRGTLRRATECYLGSTYPQGHIVWRMYHPFGEDEFVGSASDNGLAEIDSVDVERFLLSLGVRSTPRMVKFCSGNDYLQYRENIVERMEYPLKVQGIMCKTSDELRQQCQEYDIDGILVPDRWVNLLAKGDAEAVAAYLLSSGSTLLTQEYDSNAVFTARFYREKKQWPDRSIPIQNSTLCILKDTAWIPSSDGQRRRPSEIMLSNQGLRILGDVYFGHRLNPKDELIMTYGGRGALEPLLSRLGAVTSLEHLGGDSLYDLLLALPIRDPNGKSAPRVYRTIVESDVTVDDALSREKYLRSGKAWGGYKGTKSYLPINQLRYNSNLSITEAIESHIPLVDIPRRKSTNRVKQVFGISNLTHGEIELTMEPEKIDYDPCSDEAHKHFQSAMPYIYALRLARTVDEQGRELRLLSEAKLSVVHQVSIAARLPGDISEEIVLKETGKSIVVGTSLVIVGEYNANGPGFLTFWLSVGGLVAELLGTDVADEASGVLRCRTPEEMDEVVHVKLGQIAEKNIAEAKARFADAVHLGDEEEEIAIPPPVAAVSSEPTRPSQITATEEFSIEDAARSNGLPLEMGVVFRPIAGPDGRPTKRRKLVVTKGPSSITGDSRGQMATEDVTFKVVEEFERGEGRFTIRVSHLEGSESFGCDMISVSCEETRLRALSERKISENDVVRYIEIKGRGDRTTDVELSDNQLIKAKVQRERFWIYRVFRDASQACRFEIAILRDPLGSKAVRTITRFRLAEGSGALWYSMEEIDES